MGEVLITPDALQSMLHAAYVAGCEAVQANYQPDPDPEFSEAAYDYVASLDFTTTTRPARSEAQPSGYDGGKSLGERLRDAWIAALDGSPEIGPWSDLATGARTFYEKAALTFTASLSDASPSSGDE